MDLTKNIEVARFRGRIYFARGFTVQSALRQIVRGTHCKFGIYLNKLCRVTTGTFPQFFLCNFIIYLLT